MQGQRLAGALMPRLLACVSNHGYGHFGQVAPVLRALTAHLPELELHIHSTLPVTRLQDMLGRPFHYQAAADDHGLIMASSLDVCVAETIAAYAAVHADWGTRLAATSARIAAVRPNVVLADVPYLSIAAAAGLGIPSVLLASFTWAHAYQAYCGSHPGSAEVVERMLVHYRQAELMLMPAPSMAMPELPAGIPIGPLARLGKRDSAGLRQGLGVAPETRLVVVFLGGVDTPLPIDVWPVTPGVHWIFANTSACERTDFHRVADVDLDYIDLLASSDAIITKPGYGSTVEAVCNGIPMLYARRGTWPEETGLLAWLHAHGRGAEVSREDLWSGNLLPALEAIWAEPASPPPEPTGAAEAAMRIADLFSRMGS